MGLCSSQGTQTRALYQSRGVGWRGSLEGVQDRWDIFIPTADSCDA